MEELEKDVEDRITSGVTKGVTNLVTAAVTFAVMVIFLKFIWAWTVPDLFPGAVTQGLINGEISWLETVKLALLSSAMVGGYHTLIGSFTQK